MTDGLGFQDNMPLPFIGDDDGDIAVGCPSLTAKLSQPPTNSFHIRYFCCKPEFTQFFSIFEIS